MTKTTTHFGIIIWLTILTSLLLTLIYSVRENHKITGPDNSSQTQCFISYMVNSPKSGVKSIASRVINCGAYIPSIDDIMTVKDYLQKESRKTNYLDDEVFILSWGGFRQ